MANIINNQPIYRGIISIPQWGIWCADLLVDTTQENITGICILRIGDTILSGHAQSRSFQSRLFVRVVGGAGAWVSMVSARAYRNDATISKATIIKHLAAEVGEHIIDDDVSGLGSMGTRYLRPHCMASTVLQSVVPNGWHIDTDGITRFIPWPKRTSRAEVLSVALAMPSAIVAIEDIVDVLPGAILRRKHNVDMAVLSSTVTIDSTRIRARCIYL